MTPGRWRLAGRSGLRTRLLLAFVLVCLLTTIAVTGGLYVQARNAILRRAQDGAVRTVTIELKQLYPLRNPAPGRHELGDIAGTVTDRDSSAVATYQGTHSRGGLEPDMIPSGLRETVSDGTVAWQRVSQHGEPTLIIGTPLLINDSDHGSHPSGIQVYVARSLLPEQHSIERLATVAWAIGGGALVFAILLALLAARSVLRPARDLGSAARRLGKGELHTRVAVRGSDELADVSRTFNTTAAELERHVDQLRTMEADARRFVADVSHELRTPLAALASVADLLDEEADQLPADTGRAARIVSRETHNLTRLVNDLLEISRFDSGAAALEPDDVDVASLIHATLASRGWEDDVDTELPPGVTTRLDRRRIDLVLANLVGNALRHGEPPVSVRLRTAPGWINIDVSDHGPGIDEHMLPHVFDRFSKADTARSRSEGSGLGLAIARENTRLHHDGDRHGDLEVRNSPDGGAVFTVHLPWTTSHHPDEEGGSA